MSQASCTHCMMMEETPPNDDSTQDEISQAVSEITEEVIEFDDTLVQTANTVASSEHTVMKTGESAVQTLGPKKLRLVEDSGNEENATPEIISSKTSIPTTSTPVRSTVPQKTYGVKRASTTVPNAPPTKLLVTKTGLLPGSTEPPRTTSNVVLGATASTRDQLLQGHLLSPGISADQEKPTTSKTNLDDRSTLSTSCAVPLTSQSEPSTSGENTSTSKSDEPFIPFQFRVPKNKARPKASMLRGNYEIYPEDNETDISCAPSSFLLIKLVRRRPLLYDRVEQLVSKPTIMEKLWGSVASIMRTAGFHNVSTWQACSVRWRNIVNIFVSARKRYFMRVKKNPRLMKELPIPKSQLYRKMIWYSKHHEWEVDLQSVLSLDKHQTDEPDSDDDEKLQKILQKQQKGDAKRLKMMLLTPETNKAKKKATPAQKRDAVELPPIGDYNLAGDYFITQLRMLSFSAQRKFLKQVGDCFFRIFKKDTKSCSMPPMIPQLAELPNKKKTRTVSTQITCGAGTIPSLSYAKPFKAAPIVPMSVRERQNLRRKALRVARRAAESAADQTDALKQSGVPVVQLTDITKHGVTPKEAREISTVEAPVVSQTVEIPTTNTPKMPTNQPSVTKPNRATSSTLNKIPLSKSPSSKTPLSKTPLSKTPLSKTPLSKIPSSKSPLSQTPLSKSPLSQTPLSKSPLSQTPLKKIPLSQIPLSKSPLSQTPLNKIPLSKSLLSQIPLSNSPLSQTPLNKIPLNKIRLNKTPFMIPSTSANKSPVLPVASMLQPGQRFVLLNRGAGAVAPFVPILNMVQNRPITLTINHPQANTSPPKRITPAQIHQIRPQPTIPRKNDEPIIYTVEATTSNVKVERTEPDLQIGHVFSVSNEKKKPSQTVKDTRETAKKYVQKSVISPSSRISDSKFTEKQVAKNLKGNVEHLNTIDEGDAKITEQISKNANSKTIHVVVGSENEERPSQDGNQTSGGQQPVLQVSAGGDNDQTGSTNKLEAMVDKAASDLAPHTEKEDFIKVEKSTDSAPSASGDNTEVKTASIPEKETLTIDMVTEPEKNIESAGNEPTNVMDSAATTTMELTPATNTKSETDSSPTPAEINTKD